MLAEMGNVALGLFDAIFPVLFASGMYHAPVRDFGGESKTSGLA